MTFHSEKKIFRVFNQHENPAFNLIPNFSNVFTQPMIELLSSKKRCIISCWRMKSLDDDDITITLSCNLTIKQGIHMFSYHIYIINRHTNLKSQFFLK